MGRGLQVEGCGQCMKYTLWIVNLICLVGGIAVLAVGAWIVADKSYMQELLGSNLYISAAYILVATGVIITLLSLMGCLGAIKEIRCMLLTYALLLFLIFVILLIGGILGFIFRAEVEETVETQMRNSLAQYTRNELAKKAWDDAQTYLECCGVRGPDDWGVYLFLRVGTQVPRSCCRRGVPDCIESPSRYNVYNKGCLDAVKIEVKENARIAGIVAILISLLLLLGIIFSCALFKSIQ